MKEIEFGIKCQKLNDQYYKLFGYFPDYYDYSVNREGYILALEECIKEKVEIDTLLDKYTTNEENYDT